MARDDRGLLQALLGVGRPLLLFSGLVLVLAGGFALFLSASKHFLPHDVHYLGMTAEELCRIADCRIVYSAGAEDGAEGCAKPSDNQWLIA